MSHSPCYNVYKGFWVYCKRHNQGWLHNLWDLVQNENMRPWPQSPALCKCSPIAALGRRQQWSSADLGRRGPGGAQGIGSWLPRTFVGGKEVACRPPKCAPWSRWFHLQNTNSNIKILRISLCCPQRINPLA